MIDMEIMKYYSNDWLWLGLMKAIYKDEFGDSKIRMLEKNLIENRVDKIIEDGISPEQIVLIKATVYDVLYEKL